MSIKKESVINKSFLVVVEEGFTRDIQIYAEQPIDADTDLHAGEKGWKNINGSVAVGIYTTDCTENAILEASKKHDIYSGNMKAYEIID